MNSTTTRRTSKAIEISGAELVHLNVSAPAEYDEAEHRGESWANELISYAQLEDLYAPDYDGTTSGDSKGINILLTITEQNKLIEAAKQLGCEVWVARTEMTSGIYGDSQQSIKLAQLDCDTFFWIEN